MFKQKGGVNGFLNSVKKLRFSCKEASLRGAGAHSCKNAQKLSDALYEKRDKDDREVYSIKGTDGPTSKYLPTLVDKLFKSST